MTDRPGCLGSTTVNAQAHRGYLAADPRLDRGENSSENRGKNRCKTALRPWRDQGKRTSLFTAVRDNIHALID